MEVFNQIFIYLALFVGLYFQVFMILTYFVWPKKEKNLMITDPILLPTVSIIVPCFNEGNTVEKTMHSLLALDYPKEKLDIVVIDDGSTDNTWEVVQQFKDNPQVRLFHKENEGSKFAALNFALDLISTEIVGCLDADSSVDSQALRHSVQFFKNDENVSAVIPAMTIDNPKNILQYMQKVEYEMITFSKKVFHDLESIYVAPGPFALFRKEVFDTLGYYKEAHHTEDLEITFRILMSGKKVAFSSESYVYTVAPRKLIPLIKQRVRWMYGFIKNMLDYKFLLFKTDYKHIGILVLPANIFGILSVLILVPLIAYSLIKSIYFFIEKTIVTGWIPGHVGASSWFFIDTRPEAIIRILTIVILITTIFLGRSILKKKYLSWDILAILIYPYISIIWTVKAIWNAIRSKKSAWR